MYYVSIDTVKANKNIKSGKPVFLIWLNKLYFLVCHVCYSRHLLWLVASSPQPISSLVAPPPPSYHTIHYFGILTPVTTHEADMFAMSL